MTIDKKHIIIAVIFLMMGLIAGFTIGHVLGEGDRQAFALEKAKPPVVKETVKNVTETKLAYIPGETVYLPGEVREVLVTPVSIDDPNAKPTKLDGKFTFDKPDFIFMVNGKVGKFTKTDEEQFIFEKNMMDLKHNSTITIQAEIPTIDNTRRNSITGGVMYTDGKISPAVGYTGSVGKVGTYQLVGGRSGGYVGIGVKF